MICDQCKTELPDEAAACWKCGRPFKPAQPAATTKEDPTVVVAFFSFILSVGFFICGGWGVPFTVWGKTLEAARTQPGMEGQMETIAGVLFVVSAIGVFGGLWAVAFWVGKRLMTPPTKR